ncbi:MAG TPA: hotdog domain-containing protein [Kofleriaceae bacterium]|jgi:acyl-CoA hydrolase|nr:hotdog domain-containing protein [Kofleriaceae bacterium]
MTYAEPDPDRRAQTDPSCPTGRPSGEVHIDEWVAPDACDDTGFLRPGKILEWMDVVGALAATRYVRAPVVTASVDGLELSRRIGIGERVTMRARVVHTGHRSIGVAVEMVSGGRPALSAFMTFAVVGADGHASPVPRFRPETPEEMTRHREGEARARFRRELAGGRAAPRSTLAPVAPAVAAAGEPGLVLFLRDLGQRLTGRRRGDADVRSPDVSYVHKIEPVRSGKLNFHGTLYGGTLMRWLETCAAMSATAFLSAPPRLVAVDGLAFLRPVAPNVFVHLDAIAVHSDADGVTVMVRAVSEDPLATTSAHTLRGFFTYAPVDPSVAIPALARGGADDELFCEVVLRQQLRRRIAEQRAR